MKKTTLIIGLMLIALVTQAQLVVTGGQTAMQLAEMIAGPNVNIISATITGDTMFYGTVANGNTTNLGLNSGVLLTCGDRNLIIGPNSTTNATGGNLIMPGDSDLTITANQETLDACVLEFQFEVQTSSIEFKYVFGSEEYIEFTTGEYNDAFAFYISGPGITGKENIALIPGTSIPVVTNTINQDTYWQYYVNNPLGSGTTIQYDGFTTVLTARKTGLIPCQIYTLKLAIADGTGGFGDNTWDSGVVIQENSLVQGTLSAVAQTIRTDSVALEGCTKASFTFSLDQAQATDTRVVFNIEGTALNGVDYSYIDSIFTIPAGQTSATVTINALTDGFTEGRESISLIYSPIPCAPKDTVKLYIDDFIPLTFTMSATNVTCNGASNGQINITNTGGASPYTYNLVGIGTYNTSPITNLSPGLYTVKVSDSYGCGAAPAVQSSLYSAGPVFLPDGNGQSYTTTNTISGFPSGSTLTNLSNLVSICMNMEHSAMGEVKIELIAPNGTTIVLKETQGNMNTDLGEPVAKGPTDGNNTDLTPGDGYDYCFTTTPAFGTMMSEARNYRHTYVDNTGRTLTGFYLPAGAYASYQPLSNLIGVPLNGTWTLKITDQNPQDNGYVFNWSIAFRAGLPVDTIRIIEPVKPTVTNTTTLPNCGVSNGAINITVSGGVTPYTYLWSNGATTEDITGVPAGNYTVSVKDGNNCTYTYSILLQNSGTLALSATTVNEACVGANNGSVNLNVTGGTAGYTYAWSSGQSTQDISNQAPGNYTVNVTDAAGCKGLLTATIQAAVPISVTNTLANETCGNENGTINQTITGGKSPYTYVWSNSQTTEDVLFMQAGTYTVTITDANNCTANKTYTIINEVTACNINCTVALGSGVVTNENCGNVNGIIDITVLNGQQPYEYTWSNGATTQDLTNIAAGTYSVTVKDANNCTLTGTYTVTNITTGLTLTEVITAEVCGNTNGAIDITPNGGTLPYTYSWSNGTVNEDLTTLKAGIYTVTVTDATGCKYVKTYNLPNNSGTLSQTWGNVMDEKCGNGKGSVDITIVGGNWPYTYSWSNGTNIIATTEDLKNKGAGTYTCTIRDLTGCKITTPAYTIANDPGTLAIFDTDVFDEVCSNANGRINLDITGGSSPYTFLWNSGQTTQTINNLTAGTYTCQVTDSAGCSLTSSVITVANSGGTLVLSSMNIANETCSNGLGSINLSITGGNTPYTYLWNTGATTKDLTNLSGGTYVCTITDAVGCKVYANTTIANTTGTLAIGNQIITNETCGNSNGAVNILVSGATNPVVYNWSNGTANEDLSGVAAGTYTCTITDGQGCTVTTTATVTNATGTLAVTKSITGETCGGNNGAIVLTITGGATPYTYMWSNGATTKDITGISSGTYSCTITDNNNCKVLTGNMNVNNLSNGLSHTLASLTNENCGDDAGAIDITIAGGTTPYTYDWSNGATTQDISGLAAGTYTVTVTDNNNCSTTQIYTVANNTGTLVYTGQAVTNAVCGNTAGAINISYTGGTAPVTYAWSNGATTEDISGIVSGTYSCTITDNTGCSVNTGNIMVGNSSGTLALTNTAITDEVCGNNTGSVTITLAGGNTPYTYLWNNGATTQNITGLSAGMYTCTITDNNNCKVYASAVVNNTSGSLYVTNSYIKNATCDNNNGYIKISPTGGAIPYTYTWSNGATTDSIYNIPGGSYTCTIVDGTGCSINYTTSIANLSGPAVTYFTTNETCGRMDGAIFLTATGNGPYTYSWNTGATTKDITGLWADTYTCTVKDSNNCQQVLTVDIQNTIPFYIADTVINNATCSVCPNGSIYITMSNTGGFSYQWSNGRTTKNLINVLPGTYTLTYTRMGCTQQATFVIGVTLSAANVEQKRVLSYSVYPNPSNGIFNIKYPDSETQFTTVSIYNVLGEKLAEIPLKNNDKNEAEIDMQKYENGIYFMEMKQENALSERVKIILSK